MNSHLRSQLSTLPALSSANRVTLACRICGGPGLCFDVVDFNKFCSTDDFYHFGISGIQVTYYRCTVCGFIGTDFFDDWASSDFEKFIYNSDYIKVDGEYAGARPEREAARLSNLLDGEDNLRILDYGSGSGLFERKLRALGFQNIESYDPFSSPCRPEGSFDVITCSEVLEHSVAPLATIADIEAKLSPGGCVIFTTLVQPADIAEIRANWWYLAPRNGHVCSFTEEALSVAASRSGLTLYSGPGGMAFARRNVSTSSLRILGRIGVVRHFLRLTAPSGVKGASPTSLNAWHSIEDISGARIRWTRSGRVDFEGQVSMFCDGPARIVLTIPILMEVTPGFADKCKVFYGERSYPLERRANTLVTNLTLVEPFTGKIILETPSPLRPSDLRHSTDTRQLGLAILCD